MAFILTQEQVFDETVNLPAEILRALRPHIAGPQAKLLRYPEEKADISLGTYNSTLNVAYNWPNRPAGSVVDLSYVRVFIEEAMLRYFTDLIAGGGTIAPVAPFTNRIATTALGFKENGAFLRNAALFDRDVQLNDVVFLSDAGVNSMWTFVADLIADVIAAIIAAATSDAGNAGTQVLASSTLQTGGVVNDITAVESAAVYNGLPDGSINEVYTIEFVLGGAPAAARFNLTSSSGLDNATNVTPSAFAVATPIGARGLTLTWSNVVDNFVIGQKWTVTVAQAFTAPVPTSSGTYTGTEAQGDPKYIIEVTLGGKYADPTKPQITCITDDGTDFSGPTTVPATATAVAVGSRGVMVAFSGTALRKGDKYYIQVTGPKKGAYKTIVLGDQLTAPLLAALNLNLYLHLKKDSLEVAQNRISAPPNLNWVAGADTITINAGITAYDPSFTNLGVPFAVPVVSGPNTILYVQHRDWLATFQGLVNDFSVDPDLDMEAMVGAIFGTVDPDNPLSFAMFKAAQNANGKIIKYTGIADPNNVDEWLGVLDLLVGLKDVAYLVPLTHIQEVQDAYKTHVDTQSLDTVGGEWRRVVFALQAQTSTVLVDETTTSDDLVAKATILDNPSIAGLQYTLVTCTTGNAKFVTKGVRSGDVVRALYSTDPFGALVYQEFLVSSVVNEDQLILQSGPSVPVNVAAKFEVWRNLTKTESADLLADQIQAVGDRRVNFVWPDMIDVGSELVDGYFLCAAIATYAGSIMPHQGMQNLSISGFDDATRSSQFFSNAQLNILAQAGCIVVAKDTTSGLVYIRDSRTSDQSSPANGQEMIVRNEDSIRYEFYNRVAPFFGQANNTPTARAMIESEIITIININQSSTYLDRLGSSIIDVLSLIVREHLTLPDVMVVQAEIVRPYSIGNVLLTIIFS